MKCNKKELATLVAQLEVKVKTNIARGNKLAARMSQAQAPRAPLPENWKTMTGKERYEFMFDRGYKAVTSHGFVI